VVRGRTLPEATDADPRGAPHARRRRLAREAVANTTRIPIVEQLEPIVPVERPLSISVSRSSQISPATDSSSAPRAGADAAVADAATNESGPREEPEAAAGD